MIIDMKKTNAIFSTIGMLAILGMFTGCEPQMDSKPDIGTAPTESQVTFSVAPQSGSDFNFVIENTSSVVGIPSFDLGNGSKLQLPFGN